VEHGAPSLNTRLPCALQFNETLAGKTAFVCRQSARKFAAIDARIFRQNVANCRRHT